MSKKIKPNLRWLARMALLLLMPVIGGCEEDEVPESMLPTLTTTSTTDLSRSKATLQGTAVARSGDLSGVSIGFLYSTSASLNDATEVAAKKSGNGNVYAADVSALKPGSKYYYCIFARSGHALVKGQTMNFETDEVLTPSISVTTVNDISESGCSLSAAVVDDGGDSPTDWGFVYSLYIENAGDPTFSDTQKHVLGNTLELSIDELAANNTYIVRAFATNSAGTGYGESVVFTTSALRIPSVIINGYGSLANTSIVCGAYNADIRGGVTTDQGFEVTEYGVCYSSESRQPTVESSQYIAAMGGSSAYLVTLNNLSPSTKYYARAYAKNEKGVGYSNTAEFTTDKEQVVSLTQVSVVELTSSTAQLQAFMGAENESVVTEKGFCYGTSENPDTSGDKVVDSGTDNSKVDVTVTGLGEGSTYHARAYAVTRDGTFYSGDVVFTTETTYTPTLAEPSVYDITETGAKVRGEISTNGGMAVTERGIVYSSSNNIPTIEDSKVVSTDTGNSVNATLTGLSGGLTYYVRTYAVNGKGTGYSTVVDFTTTKHVVPTVSSMNVSDINDDNIKATARVASNGGDGETITDKGFVVSSTYTEPTLDNATVVKCTGTESLFSSVVSGLSYSTYYYVRAYATNSVGTGYSSTLHVRTGSSTTPSIGRNLTLTATTTSSLGFEFTFNDNGGAELTDYGVQWKAYGSSGDYTKVKGALNGDKISATISGLNFNTSYYVYGYATNKNGTVTTYSSSYSTNKMPPGQTDNQTPGDNDNTGKPQMNSVNSYYITSTTAWVSSSVSDDGNLTITERGFVYMPAESGTPTVDNATKVTVSNTSGTMSSKLTGLTPGTRYYVRSYAVNSKGVGYSYTSSFTTESSDKPSPGGDDNQTPGTN